MQMTVFDNPPQSSDDFRLEIKVHSQIRIVPVTDNAHALEVIGLLTYLPRRVSSTALAKLRS